ncbi:hypothetical protein ACH5RR_034562 [Cinchona calisaya]|uniref:VQ domain-containing protein n=1 Tax=Cinchona calisaya TaxID=153742 RepID=A0ABD2YCL5_9GENT
MDSGNSGSMQSSSGGDDQEYDSRTESISSFLNNNPSSAHFGSISDPPPHVLLPQHHPHQPTTLFNLDAAFPHSSLPNPTGNITNTTNTTTQYTNDLVWSRSGLMRSSDHQSSGQSVIGLQGLNRQSMPSHQQGIDVVANNAAKSSLLQSDQPNVVVKNPKKRTRASRRAPTTVLTTDTTNFRQMVQEFTGIPTAPFSAGSPYSRRFDLFSTGSSNLRSSATHLADSLGSLYNHPLRPSAQKLQLSAPFVVQSSDHHLGMPKQPHNHQELLNMQNQLLSFQPLLQASSSSQANNNASVPSFDDLGLGHHHHENVNANLGGFPTSSSLNGQENLGGATPNQQITSANYKFNCSGSTSEFHHDKGLETVVASGGEGTVGSWICPSD